MPKLPVATAFWTPEPSLETGAAAWIYAGGAHHTAFSYDLTADQVIRHYDVTGKICPKYFVEDEDAWVEFRRNVQDALEKQ